MYGPAVVVPVAGTVRADRTVTAAAGRPIHDKPPVNDEPPRAFSILSIIVMIIECSCSRIKISGWVHAFSESRANRSSVRSHGFSPTGTRAVRNLEPCCRTIFTCAYSWIAQTRIRTVRWRSLTERANPPFGCRRPTTSECSCVDCSIVTDAATVYCISTVGRLFECC